jgi:hypothetical protein
MLALQGSMYQFETVLINLASSPELLLRVDAFRRRAADLIDFIRSQKWGIQNIHIDRSNQERPTIKGSLPNDLVLEGLYRRYRFFILNDEKANYYRFIRLLSASSKNELLHRFLRVEKKEFLQSRSLEFAFITSTMKYRAEDVIDCWFNSYYFHDQDSERERLVEFEKIVSPEGAKVMLWQSVWDSALKVRNMSWLIRDTSVKNPVVYVPVSCAL